MFRSFYKCVIGTFRKFLRALWAIVLLVFAPSWLTAMSVRHTLKLREQWESQQRGASEDLTSQFRGSIGKIRCELLWALIIACCVVAAALITAAALQACGVRKAQILKAVLQYGGIAVLLLATLGRVESGITTHGHGTLPEKVNAWVYELLYCVGSYALVLSVAVNGQ